VVTPSVRLVPRWFSALVIVVLGLFALGMLALALVDDGVVRWSAWGLSAAAGLVLCSAVSALVVPRSGRPIRGADGTVTFLSPALTVWPLVGAWAAVLWVAATWAYVAVTDFGELESPGFALVTVVGAVGSLPDLARLVTGRLHRWRVVIGPESITYRGYRTDRTWPLSKIHGARFNPPRSLRLSGARSDDERQLAGVVIDLKGAGADPVIPMAAFRAAPQTMIEEIERAKAAARR
jgi:hypothetical protein